MAASYAPPSAPDMRWSSLGWGRRVPPNPPTPRHTSPAPLSPPSQIFKEMHRCLKPGGTAIMSFSNRCFPTKAISLWTATPDIDHVWIVGSYFHYSVPGGFSAPACKDISPNSMFGRTDPMYVVYASKV